ncbi:TetR/AcrR family transcriptional regulator [Streptomyces sp. NPDC002851]
MSPTPSKSSDADETTTSVDGRRAKGARRRQALIDATLRVIERDGASGVTHRTVAREAELPATASTYYFESIDALLTAALTSCMNEDADRVRALIDAPDNGEGGDKRTALAALMSEAVAAKGHLLAEFELCLLASRRPELRGPTRRWKDALCAFARLFTDDPLRVQVFANAYDGLLLQGLLADEPPTTAEFEAMVGQLLPGGPGAAAR